MLSVMVTAAVIVPATVGAKYPLMVQLAPEARLVPQLFANTKEEAFVPVTAMLVMVNAAVPVLLIVTDCEVLAVPTATVPYEREVAERDTAARPDWQNNKKGVKPMRIAHTHSRRKIGALPSVDGRLAREFRLYLDTMCAANPSNREKTPQYPRYLALDCEPS
ncbi:MAG: hypothetical protein P4N59_22720 [Negativicutes bacterium]|nr:hypothetical protein [Negativicutes bacterium]